MPFSLGLCGAGVDIRLERIDGRPTTCFNACAPWCGARIAKDRVDHCTGAVPSYLPSLERHELSQWYKDSKFGIFIHGGAYSVHEGA